MGCWLEVLGCPWQVNWLVSDPSLVSVRDEIWDLTVWELDDFYRIVFVIEKETVTLVSKEEVAAMAARAAAKPAFAATASTEPMDDPLGIASERRRSEPAGDDPLNIARSTDLT